MKSVCAIWCVLIALFVFYCPVSGQAPERAPVELMVLCAPTPIYAEGKVHLVYELHVTNFDEKPITLTRVEVLGDRSAAPLKTYEGSSVEEQLRTPGRNPSEKALLGGGQRLIVFIWVSLNYDVIPTKLRHRLTFGGSAAEGQKVQMSVEAGETPVRQEKAIVIRPPLRGGPWRANGGPSNDSLHRRAAMAVDGKTCDAQRFAIDWVKLGPNGRSCDGDCSKNENFYSYGGEILSVADGTVSELVDGIPDNIPGSVLPYTFETGLGNHVILDLGSGHYAFYAHMQPGKMRVNLGDHVRAGQILGLVGNSGNARGPHLHFHLMDRPSPLGSEGLPYVLDSFEVNGHTRRMEIPLENTVVTFPESR